VDEAPAESTEFLAIKLKSQADNVTRNGWNGNEAGKGAAGDVGLGNMPDTLGQVAIGMAGLFGKSGIRTSIEFDKRLKDWSIKDEEALNVYNNGQKYTDEQGRWLRWDPKSKLTISIDPFDGGANTIYENSRPSNTWISGWWDITQLPDGWKK